MLKKLWLGLGWALLALLLALVSFVLLTSRQGWEYDAVLSGSMTPAFEVGGLVVIRPVDPATLQVGDVISFRYPTMSTPICHRITAVVMANGSPVFQTRGDANDASDQSPVSASMVQGRAVLYLPHVGRLADVAQAGRQKVAVLGHYLPLASLAVFALGLLFITLTTRETAEALLRPGRVWAREMKKRRGERLARRRRMFAA